MTTRALAIIALVLAIILVFWLLILPNIGDGNEADALAALFAL